MDQERVEIKVETITNNERSQSPLLREINVEQRLLQHLDRFDNQLQELRIQQRERHPKTTKKHTFKYKSNDMQYKLNMELAQNLQNVMDDFKEGAIDRGIREVGAVIEKLNKRNKILKIADRSPGGWDTIEEYLSDDLADNSADERKIRAAENRAVAKKKEREKKSNPYQRPTATITSRPQGYSNSQSSNIFRWGTYTRQPPDYRSNNYQSNQYTNSRRLGDQICFACGRRGHWRRYCPNTQQTDQRTGSVQS